MGKPSTISLTLAEYQWSVRKAYNAGVRAERKRFDAMLAEHLRQKQLGELNGTTELFKHQWSESKHPRDHGKFASKEGTARQEGGSDGGSQLGSDGARPAHVPGGVADPGAVPATHETVPSSVDTPAPLTAIPEEHLLDGLHSEVPPGLWQQVRESVVKAASVVHQRLVLATPAFLKLQHLLTRIESPDDLKQLGYTPLTSGVAGHTTPDALRDGVGIPGVLGARLVSHVLSKVVSWMKGEAAVGKAVDETDDSDAYSVLGSALSDALALLTSEFGGDAASVPDGGLVAAKLRAMEGKGEGKSAPPAKFSYVGVTLRGPVLEELQHVQSQIRDEDLGEDGRETEYHVTVRYGLHTDDAEDVRPILSGFGPVAMTFGKPTCFLGSESGKDYDVIILPVDSPDLHRLHGLLGPLPHTDTHPEYKPHLTIAYVKAGLGEKYANEIVYARTTFRETVNSVVFSNRLKEKTVIPLDVPPSAPPVDTAVIKGFDENEKRDESGKWTSSGGGEPGSAVPDDRTSRQANRDARRERATTARMHHDLNAPMVLPNWHEGETGESHQQALDEHLKAYDSHNTATRSHLAAAGATDKELAEFDKRVSRNRADLGRHAAKVTKHKGRRDAAEAALTAHDAKREEIESREPQEDERDDEEAFDAAHSAWETELDKHDDNRSDLEDRHADASDSHDEAAADYAADHAESIDHIGEHVSAVEDAIHGRIDEAEENDPEIEEEVAEEESEEDSSTDTSPRPA